ncbi:WDR77 [Lepeophtheirus salmonis]|uniref:WDR77 n=1 Tax=Lepeophtheirus salmonis TaxID=72036 RepID=A0A7R8D2E4_LEPSM|nr:WDR77 [Lepeophtheirus salmonis]CAF3004667.1 WDR77 [Lepeophtheirus salmonis]
MSSEEAFCGSHGYETLRVDCFWVAPIFCGRTWTGSAWYYHDPKEAPEGDSAAIVECDDGVSDGLFLNDDMVVVALDSGALETLVLKEGPYFERVSAIIEHDDLITGLTRSPDSIMTSSYDKTIVVYDIATSLALNTRLHSWDLVTDVASNPLDPFILASGSCDGIVHIWDLRSPTFPSIAYDNASDWPTALTWSPQDDKSLLVGMQSGEIGNYDLRQLKCPPVSSTNSMDKQIHRIVFSPTIPDIFAVSADSYPVRIFDIEGFKTIYKDERHEDFVRGLAWHPKNKDLWTCGWDRRVLSHSLDFLENKNVA